MTAIQESLEGEPQIVSTAPRFRLIASIGDAARARIALVLIVLLAGLLYGWNLTVSGYANTYYSAAAQAASQSWTAFFFGSLDGANFITVDKPPVAIWLMGLSVRVFGLSSWSILVPEAIAGVATVGVLFVTVRRTFGTIAATSAGIVMALTPAAVLIFRYNNPDALLTLLLVSAAWAVSRGLDAGRLRWAILAGVLVGFAFLTKYLQAYLVLPAFATVWLVAAPVTLRRRLGGLLAAGLAVLLSSGWWVAIVELIPAANRPFIGGSQTNSALELLLGYDGLGRIFGIGGPGPVAGGFGAASGGGAGGGGFGGDPGLLRMFNDQFGGQIAWFIPLALLSLGAGLWIQRRAPRTDARRAAYLLWGAWLAVHVLVFSFMSGIIHSYYVVALAPAIAALVGAGVCDLWRQRSRHVAAGVALGLGLAATGWLAWQLLERTPEFAPGLGAATMIGAAVAAVVVSLPPRLVRSRLPAGAIAVGLVALLSGPIAYAADSAGTAYSGGDPAAGPAVAGTDLGGGFARGGGNGFVRDDGNGFDLNDAGAAGGTGNIGAPAGGPTRGGGESVSDELVAYLLANRGSATWIVAADSANQAAAIQLAAGQPVMAMGGFSGADPAPTLEHLQAYVGSGRLRFVMAGGADGGPGGGPVGRGDGASGRDAWLAANCKAVSVGGTTVYDCAAAAG